MSLQDELDARTNALNDILDNANTALSAKGGRDAATLNDVPRRIAALPMQGSGNLQEGEVFPDGTTFDVFPDDGFDGFSVVTVYGDDNLVPEKLPLDLTIYGVSGTSPMMQVPDKYLEYVNYCRTSLYSGKYSNIIIWENDEYIAVSFLMDNFSVESYDPYTSELTAIGWHTCGYTKATGAWSYTDYTDEESPGESFAKNIAFASCEIVYGGQTLFPVGTMTALEAESVTFDDDAGTCTVELATGQTEVLTFTYDDTGAVNGVKVRGRTITLAEVST